MTVAEVSLSNRGVSCAAHRYEALAQDLLSAKTQANHRPPEVRLEERHTRVEEALEWHRYNDARWGLADVEVPQVIMTPSCRS